MAHTAAFKRLLSCHQQRCFNKQEGEGRGFERHVKDSEEC